jgi:pimeloyl-ACP methyl ester carboxylesterase
MLNSVVTGEGNALVFLHGYGENLTLWEELVYPLQDNYKVITIDLPGFGESHSIGDKITLDLVAQHVNKHIRIDLGISNYYVFGHSLGGYVALALADLFPETIKGLGLINSSSYADPPDKKENRIKTADFINKYGVSFFLKSFVPDLFTQENQIQLADKVQKVVQMGQNLPVNVLTSYMLAMKDRPDRSHVLSNTKKTLFIAGEKDSRISAEDINSQLNLLKNPILSQVISHVAHMSMYEAEIELREIILSFLSD